MSGDQSNFLEINADGRSEERPLSVFQLTMQVKDLLEGSFPSVWVSGEVSNLSIPQSGHCYLTLKDEQAQTRAVIWRSTMQKLDFEIHDGLEVICKGGLDVYAPRGSYQLVIRKLVPKGLGGLERALRQLQQKLAAEGLFDPAHKKPLPRFPEHVAVVTSPTGAAIHDFLQVLRRRARGIRVTVVPVRVQGAGAAREIADAIQTVNRLNASIDVVVVGRGGGSLEDLWAFNEEPVVRAIFNSRIPVVSAVGHEIDVSLSDLAADVRALTPSEAAELVAPDTVEIQAALAGLRRRLVTGLRGRAVAARSRLDSIASRRVLRRPVDRIHELQRRLDELGGRCSRAGRRLLANARDKTGALGAQLESLGPLAVLQRGYSVTCRADDGLPVRDAATLSGSDSIVTQFARGRTVSRIEEIQPEID